MPKEDLKNLSDKALSIIFSNLAKASEKQQNPSSAERYAGLARQYDRSADSGDLAELKTLIKNDLSSAYGEIQSEAESLKDRGVLRALKWGQKATTIQKSLLERYESKGDALLEGKDIFICEACGFLFVGDAAPDICPVCKAPSSRFSVVK